MKKDLRLLPTLLVLLLLSISLTGCAEIAKTISRSDVTTEELRSLLILQTDFPEYSIYDQDVVDSIAERKILEKINGDVCDTKSINLGVELFEQNTGISINSASEPVCAGAESTLQLSRDNIENYSKGIETMLTAMVAREGGGIRDIQTVILDNSGFGDKSITLATSAEVSYDGEIVPYQSMSVIQVNDKAAVTVSVSSYQPSFPEDILTKAVTLAKSRLDLLE